MRGGTSKEPFFRAQDLPADIGTRDAVLPLLLETGMVGAKGPTSCSACFRTTGAPYLNADKTAFMQ